MSAFALILTLAVPIGVVMIAVVYAARKQQDALFRHNQSILVRQKANDLLESLEFLYQVEEGDDLHECLLNRAAQLHQKAAELEPDIEERDRQVTFFNRAQWLDAVDNQTDLRLFLRSDSELRIARQHISRMLKVLSSMKKVKSLSGDTYQAFRLRLRIRLLELQVNTFKEQGREAKAREDLSAASTYYKAAKKKLLEFDLPYERKNDLIRQMNELSANLMKPPSEDEAVETSNLEQELTGVGDPHGFPESGDEEKRRY